MVTQNSSQQERDLYFAITREVARQCDRLQHNAWFDDFDINLTERVYQRLQPRLANGDITPEEVDLHISRCVAGNLRLEQNYLRSRGRKLVRSTDEFDPLDFVPQNLANDLFEQVVWGLELDELLTEAEQAKVEELRDAALLRQHAMRIADTLPQKERQRFIAVVLAYHRGDKTYQDVAEEVEGLGYGSTNSAAIRQWVKRYTEQYLALL